MICFVVVVEGIREVLSPPEALGLKQQPQKKEEAWWRLALLLYP